MTPAERREVKALIRFYERRGWDWSLAAEYLIRKYNDSLVLRLSRYEAWLIAHRGGIRRRHTED